jgi:hypothetical protein
LASCSDPLEINNSSPEPNPGRVDTVYIFDTLTPSDSAVRVDTIWISDTVTVRDTGACPDTVTQFDTIRVTDTQLVVDTMAIVDTVTITDTNTIIDTMTLIDTVTVTETKTIYDTVTLTDTIAIVDTVTIVQPGDCDSQQVCGRISAGQKDILWMFRNDGGTYRLELSGSTERNKPLQTLVITIEGIQYTWTAGTNPLWVKELTLNANTSIRISLENPGAFGHDIDVCLVMTKL